MEQADKWDMLSESLAPKISNGAGGVALGRREGISIAPKRAAPPKSRIRRHGTHARKLVLQPSPSLRSAQCDRCGAKPPAGRGLGLSSRVCGQEHEA